jgi:hypothetical protein
MSTLDEVDPRIAGIREHLERARVLHDLGAAQTHPQVKYRLMLSAIYSCRAITEIMLEAASKQQVRDPGDPDARLDRAALELWFKPKLPYYALIECIRIHDFHRFGIVPQDPAMQSMMLGGPIKLKASQGLAGIVGGVAVASGNSTVEQQRPLYIQDGEFLDNESSKLVRIDSVVGTFLAAAALVISEFENLVGP